MRTIRARNENQKHVFADQYQYEFQKIHNAQICASDERFQNYYIFQTL